MSDHRRITRFYDRWAGIYDQVASRTPGITTVRKAAIDSVNLSTGETVVEMGCGTGANFKFLRRAVGQDGRVIGVDLTPGMVARAQRRIQRRDWSNVGLVRADAIAPPVAEADVVFGTFVIGMLDNPAAAIQTWCETLSMGGRIGLLDATKSNEMCGQFLNPVFAAFVALTAPPTLQLRYQDQPVSVLDKRVQNARDALSTHGSILTDERYAGGFLRVTIARIDE